MLGELNGHIEEMYTGHQVVKAFNREPEAIQRFSEINDRLYSATWKAQFATSIIMPVMNFLSNLSYVFVSVVGAILVTMGRIQIGAILAFIQYSRQFSQPITQLSSISNVIQSAIASAERVFEVLDAPEEPQILDPHHLCQVQGAIEFDHVSFGYVSGHPVIRDMTLNIKPGQRIAVVGESGAGKTTLVNLLMHFYNVITGSIRIDGVDIRFIPRPELHHVLGMILQDTWLFHGTIRDNIAYGQPEATNEKILAAAKTAQVHHFIQTLPQGYDTVLNEEAINISSGQKQLLTIARAIMVNPPILILDEATSSVDTRAEVLIQLAMDHLMQGRTSLIIAHRLSTIQDADHIVVMEKGRIREQGTHLELCQLRGYYWQLYRSQYAHPEDLSKSGRLKTLDLTSR